MIRYLKIFFLSILILIVLAQVAAAKYFFRLMESNNEISAHRMYEIRSFPESLRCGLVLYWTAKNLHPDGDVLVLGDSQTFGYNARHDSIFSAVLDRNNRIKGTAVKNASIVDGHFDDAQNVLRIVAAQKIRLKNIIINVDPAHFKSKYHVPKHLPTYQCGIPTSSSVLLTPDLLTSMKELAIQNFRNPSSSAPWLLRAEDADPQPPEIMSGPLPSDYITEVNDKKYEEDFISFLETANTAAERTIVYMSPMQVYKKLPEAQANIRKRYMEICEDFALSKGGVICLDPSSQFEKKDFVDIVHLSSSGHKKLADLLAKKLWQAD